tara:strand:- start:5486 stop:6046 length:561 start_codon:yes stop_codon:yes gene_type:complete
MKTFLTEKHNIPKGATHYMDETDDDLFAWYREDTKEVMVDGYLTPEWESAVGIEDLSDLKPIPQTKEVEWVNGEQCISSTGYEFTFIGLCNYSGFDCILMSDEGVPTFGFTKELSKPETEDERVEREELEARKRLIDSSELPNSSRDKVSAILTMVEDVYGSGALFSVVDLLEGFNCEGGRYLQDK